MDNGNKKLMSDLDFASLNNSFENPARPGLL